LWLPVFLHQHQVGTPYATPMSLTDKTGYFVVMLLIESMPVQQPVVLWSAFLAIVLASVALTRGAVFRSDAGALAAIYAVVLLELAATNITRIQYLLPAYALLCVFIAYAIGALVERMRSENLRLWRPWGAGAVAALCAAFVVADAVQAVDGAALPCSGIRTFVQQRALQADTLYVLAPDYLAPTFAFYARGTPVDTIGFARIEHPELFTLEGYVTLWNDPAAIDDAMNAIARAARDHEFVDYVAEQNVVDHGRMPYRKVWQLLARLRERYRLVDVTKYPASWEPVIVYRFKTPELPLESHETGQGR